MICASCDALFTKAEEEESRGLRRRRLRLREAQKEEKIRYWYERIVILNAVDCNCKCCHQIQFSVRGRQELILLQ